MTDPKNSRRNIVKAAGVVAAGAALNLNAHGGGLVAETADNDKISRTYDVTAFGAKGYGKTIDTPAIKQSK